VIRRQPSDGSERQPGAPRRRWRCRHGLGLLPVGVDRSWSSTPAVRRWLHRTPPGPPPAL